MARRAVRVGARGHERFAVRCGVVRSVGTDGSSWCMLSYVERTEELHYSGLQPWRVISATSPVDPRDV